MTKKSKLTKKSYHTSDLEVFKQLTMKSHRIVYNKWFLVTFFMYLVFALICYTTKGDDGDCLVPFLTHLRQDTMTHQIIQSPFYLNHSGRNTNTCSSELGSTCIDQNFDAVCFQSDHQHRKAHNVPFYSEQVKETFIDLSKRRVLLLMYILYFQICRSMKRKTDNMLALKHISIYRIHNTLSPYYVYHHIRHERGGRLTCSKVVSIRTLLPYISDVSKHMINQISLTSKYVCTGHKLRSDSVHTDIKVIYCKFPSIPLYMNIPRPILWSICKDHNIKCKSRATITDLRILLLSHKCETCDNYVLEFSEKPSSSKSKKFNKPRINSKQNTGTAAKKKRSSERSQFNIKTQPQEFTSSFPPNPLTRSLESKIINDWCSDFSPDSLEEQGCTVCGRLSKSQSMLMYKNLDYDQNLLSPSQWGVTGVTRQPRTHARQEIREINGPVLDEKCDKVCQPCAESLMAGKTPQHALANGLWLGQVPQELRNLSYAEKLMVARVRHNRCIVSVKSGMHKMRANAIIFSNPTPKVYNILPPPREEMDDVLAFIFTGPCQPTLDDFKRTPLLVRRNAVSKALEWLKLNHSDYADLIISYDNLNQYPEDMPPVMVDYHCSDGETNKDPESTAVNDVEDETGVDEGDCPFTVHGLSGEQLSDMPLKALKANAIMHLRNKGKVLAIGHSTEPESTYDNPQLYPKMLPWLFPYGLGGVRNHRIQQTLAEPNWIRHMLMYHDKRFQTDQYFPLIALNHQQMKQSSRAGAIVTERHNFDKIMQRILNVNLKVLQDLSQKLSSGEHVKCENEDEKICFDLLNDLDTVSGHVQGSLTAKKYMRNEIWSLISFTGAATWFLTFAPADVKHPYCLYLADQKITFKPEVRDANERYSLIARNPVAGARFFHYMVQMFLKHVVGVNSNDTGLYGKPAAYYGTVEQQGRLTLHLHLMLWVQNAMSPQEIRERFVQEDSEFQQSLIDYLERCHKGEFITGTMEQVKNHIDKEESNESYINPTETLPDPPPFPCDDACGKCEACTLHEQWWDKFPHVVDDIIMKSNVHRCSRICMANRHNTCKARFPRETCSETKIDLETGSLTLKKREEWINFFTPILSYLIKCNSDVTSLLSGTAIKAIVAYVTEYITKVPLKTHAMFDIIRNMFDKKSEIVQSNTLTDEEKAKRLMVSMVNSMTASMEIGGPMAALYLLDNPDHYTSHKFRVFYWRPYVAHVINAFKSEDEENQSHEDAYDSKITNKVMLMRSRSDIVAYSATLDYIYRPQIFNDVNLYDWIRVNDKTVKPKQRTRIIEEEQDPTLSDDELQDYDNYEEDEDAFEHAENNNLNISNGSVDTTSECEKSAEDSGDDLDLFDHDDSSNESNKNSASKYDFLAEHPQHQTHIVKLMPEADGFVPTFVNPIPRSDKGDREYYCATMMTLFKPWREPTDLKSESDSWDISFDKHIFSTRQRQLMSNFNIRYECHDAKDDYRLQRQKSDENVNVSGLAHLFTKNSSSNDFEPFEDYVQLDSTRDYEEYLITDKMGNLSRKRRGEMLQMLDILRSSGWVNKSEDGYNELSYKEDYPLFPKKTNAQWSKALADKRKQVIEDRKKNIPLLNKPLHSNLCHSPDEVKIISFLHENADIPFVDRERIQIITNKFTLNSEQERAFNIVAQHASLSGTEQLKMYLGGMGGTGKSQVIKALIQLFADRNEMHRFIVLAPTGSAAALVDGSTYHSVLAVNEMETENLKTRDNIRERTEGVEYIFVDEVSMISCHDMYIISKQLCIARSDLHTPFGGMNIIFAGDFAQLPPVRATALLDGSVGTQLHSGMNPYSQECAMGKALWHQITTVVILRQNMRQKTQTERDGKFRTALENMRYRNCTDDDIEFLKTLIAGRAQSIAQRKFAYVPIIVRYNSYRDSINEEGAKSFSQVHKRDLHTFYSIDNLSVKDNPRTRKTKQNNARQINEVLQNVLWNIPPASTKNIPGKLEICVGMPVMIKKNVATECCVTNGAQAEVYGWQSTEIPGQRGKHALDVLFVKLIDPPRAINLSGLPENVVPLTKHTISVACTLPDDSVINVSRSQMPVLLNFGMTDYASQGRTRKFNVCEIHNSKNHQAMYTALSRSSSADGTVILQGFDPKLIQGGLTGYMRQEFRELEVLNEITKLRYHKTLSSDINGVIRNSIVRQYYRTRSLSETVPEVPTAISWSENNPLSLPKAISDTPWRLVDKKKKNNNDDTKIVTDIDTAKNVNVDAIVSTAFVNGTSHTVGTSNSPAKSESTLVDEMAFITMNTNKDADIGYKVDNTSSCSNSVIKNEIFGKKRKRDEADESIQNKQSTFVKKNPKSNNTDDTSSSTIPQALKWENNSCALDASVSILFHIWRSSPAYWGASLRKVFKLGVFLDTQFFKVNNSNTSLESARNLIRYKLNKMNKDIRINRDISLHLLFSIICETKNTVRQRQTTCPNTTCGFNRIRHIHNAMLEHEIENAIHTYNVLYPHANLQGKQQSIMSILKMNKQIHSLRGCGSCGMCCQITYNFVHVPPIICIEIPTGGSHSMQNLKVNQGIAIRDTKGVKHILFLKGVVYYKSLHYMTRIIDKDGTVWFNDSITCNNYFTAQGNINMFSNEQILNCKGAVATSLIYAKNESTS